MIAEFQESIEIKILKIKKVNLELFVLVNVFNSII